MKLEVVIIPVSDVDCRARFSPGTPANRFQLRFLNFGKLAIDEPVRESAPHSEKDIARIVKETIASLKGKGTESSPILTTTRPISTTLPFIHSANWPI